ncbi:MAG: transposase [Lachnospiraceae bacterium]|nr:transposase [Lachnospiraceae bacterium]MBP3295319.1 transposase [Lachnospiraceae bacterium]
MARKKRIWYPGATYHVMSRGNRRTAIFKDVSDHLRFLECVQIIKEKHPFRIHSLCLMTNHFHIAVETQEIELWKIMQKILSIYAEEFNHKYNFTGHVFESRYTACLIEDERYFLEVSRYIHLNPVKAQMVREPGTYEYSSYDMFVHDKVTGGQKKITKMICDLVDTSRVLACFRNNPKEQYRMFVEGKISHAEQELLIQKEMKEDDMWLPW